MALFKRVYIPYWKWEDYRNGFYNTTYNGDECKVYDFMNNLELFESKMLDVVLSWENSMLHNLTNYNMNRVAYIGQCAVNYYIKAPSFVTKSQWKLLSKEAQDKANKSAKFILNMWLDEYKEKNK